MKRTRSTTKRSHTDLDDQLSSVFTDLSTELKTGFVKAAEAAGVPVAGDKIITITRARALFMSAGRIGLDQLTLQQMNAGVDIGFILVLAPDEAARRIPNGFYSVRMSGDGKAALSDRTGKLVAELPLKATRVAKPMKGGNKAVPPLMLGISAHYDDESGCTAVDVTITIFYRQFGFEVLVCPE